MSHASSVRNATIPSTSPLSTASAKRPTISRSSFESGIGARSRPVAGRRDSNAERARRSRLLTDASLLSSIVGDLAGPIPEDVAEQSTARCCGGRCWRPTMNASAIDSLASWRASGPGASSGIPSSSASG